MTWRVVSRGVSRLIFRVVAVLMSFMVAATPLLIRILPLASGAIVSDAYSQTINPGECIVFSNGRPVPVPCATDPTCTVTGGNFAVNAGTIAPPRDRGNGSVLKTVTQQTSYVVTCTGATDRDRTVNLVFALPSTETGDTYATATAGVGIRYKVTGAACRPGGESALSKGKLAVQCDVARNKTVTLSFATAADLIKTAAIVPGDFSTKPVVGVKHFFDGQAESSAKSLTNLYSSSLTGKIAPQTCLVTNANIVVKLTGDAGISPRSFSSVGSTSAPVGFNIGVDCSGVTSKVFMTLTDQQNPDNTSNTLALTRASTAVGLGIQFLFNGTPVSLGPDSSAATNTNQFAVFTSTGAAEAGTTNVPLAARYIRTGTIASGSANGVATFTMSYQ